MLSDNHDLIPLVKWLVALRNRSCNETNDIISIREFQCIGYYEAFERVQCYAEKTNAEVIWFKEKRTCGEPLIYSVQLPLGCFCTYCNLEHCVEDSIPCEALHCNSILCSRKCYEQHMKLKHMNLDIPRRSA